MKENNNTPFKVEDVNWEELAGIGILKDELEMAGELETLLRGENKCNYFKPDPSRSRCNYGCNSPVSPAKWFSFT